MGWKDKFSYLFAANYGGGRRVSDDVEIPGEADDHWYGPAGQKTAAGIRVTADRALRNSTVFACVRVIATAIASVPCEMHLRLKDGGSEPAPYHPLDELVRYQPNKIQTAVEFWETMILHAAIRGEAFAEIVPGPRGAVDQLIIIHPDRVQTEYLRDGTLRFRVSNPHAGGTRVLLQEEVFRVGGVSSDGFTGLRIIDLASEAVALGMSADEYAARVFSNNLNIGGFLTTPKRLSADGMRRLRTRLMEFMGSKNAHRPMILHDGTEFKQASMNASEAQLLEARKWQVSEIARYFGVPLHMLGIDDQTNRSTVEEQSLNFIKFTLGQWTRRIEQAIRRDLIIAASLYKAKFNLDVLEKGNAAARAEYLTKALGTGGSPAWLTQNEARVREGYNRRPEAWADELPRGNSQVAKPAVTNDTSSTAALAAPTSPPKLDDLTPDGRASRLSRKENKAFGRAMQRHAGDPDAMRDWIKAFYGGHSSAVMEILGLRKHEAKIYCDFQKKEALEANDWPALLERREENLAGTIAAVLKKHGESNGPDEAL